MDFYLGLRSRGHREEGLEFGPKSLHNSTDFWVWRFFEKVTHLSNTSKCQLHKTSRPYQQPVESIRLTLGQQWKYIIVNFIQFLRINLMNRPVLSGVSVINSVKLVKGIFKCSSYCFYCWNLFIV